MGISLEFDFTAEGPLFDGTLADGVDQAMQDINEVIAQEGVNLIQQRLRTVLQHPSGRYASNIQTERSSETTLITDGGMVYGPWLEGVGSRNATSRFKGYATFRQVAPEIEKMSQQLAEAALEQRIGGLL
jgi:hypothetical protein